MKIGIITDSHDHPANIDKAIDIFNQQQVAYIFHAGDMCSPFAAKTFQKAEDAKFIATFGNNDGEKIGLKKMIQGFGGEIHDFCIKTVINEKRIYMTHTQHNIDELAESSAYDLIIYGHTHKQDIRHAHGTLIINPGESTTWLTGKAHIAIVNLADLSYEIIELK